MLTCQGLVSSSELKSTHRAGTCSLMLTAPRYFEVERQCLDTHGHLPCADASKLSRPSRFCEHCGAFAGGSPANTTRLAWGGPGAAVRTIAPGIEAI